MQVRETRHGGQVGRLARRSILNYAMLQCNTSDSTVHLTCALTMASHLAVSIVYVTAMMGTVGRSFDTLSAVLPAVVKAMMAFDLEISATCYGDGMRVGEE